MGWPLGLPGRDTISALDQQLLEHDARLRRLRDPAEPPEGFEADPWLIPETAWRRVQAEQLRRRGSALAVHHDGTDIAFNIRVQAEREKATDSLDAFRPKPREKRKPTAFDQAWAAAELQMHAAGERSRRQRQLDVLGPDARAQMSPEQITATESRLQRGGMGPLLNAQRDILNARAMRGPYARDEMDRRLRHAFPDVGDVSSLTWDDLMSERRQNAVRLAPLQRQFQDATLPPHRTEEYLDTLKRSRRVNEALSRDGPQQWLPAWQIAAVGAIEAVVALERIAPTFLPGLALMNRQDDIKSGSHRLIRHLGVNLGVGLIEVSGGEVTPTQRQVLDRRLDEAWRETPRPIRIVVEEATNPLNWAVILKGGSLALALRNSGVRGSGLLAALLEPISKGPLPVRAATEIGAVSAGRVGWEETDGAPLPVRLAVGGAGMWLAANPKAVLSPTAAMFRTWRGTGPLVPGEATQAVRIIPWGGAKTSSPNRLADVPDILTREIPDEARHINAPGVYMPGNQTAVDSPSALDHAARYATLRYYSPVSKDPLGWQREEIPPRIALALQMANVRSVGFQLPGEGVPLYGRFAQAVNSFLAPAVRQPMHIRQANIAAGGARAEVAAGLTPSRLRFFDEIRGLFGNTDKLPSSIEYIGPAERRVEFLDAAGFPHPGRMIAAAEDVRVGTIVDAIWNPQFYDMDQATRDQLVDIMGRYDLRNSNVNEWARGDWGVAVGEFGGKPLGTSIAERGNRPFIPNVNAAETMTKHLDDQALAQSGRLKTRTFESIDARLASAEAGPGFTPVTDLEVLFTGLDNAKAAAVGREVFRYGVGGVPSVQPRPRGGWRQVDALEAWLPEEDAQAVDYLLSTKWSGSLTDIADNIRQVRFGGDASLLTIQGSLNWLAFPRHTLEQMVHGLRRGGAEGQWTRAFRADAFAADMAERPERWLDFAYYTGSSITAGTPEEMAAGWLRHIRFPKGVPVVGGRGPGGAFARLNEGTFLAMVRGMEGNFAQVADELIADGIDPFVAKTVAADMITSIVPWSRTRQLGISAGRSRLERAAFTSVAFLRRPIDFQVTAMRGFVKLGVGTTGKATGVETIQQWAALTPEERMAVKLWSKMHGTIVGLSVTSALLTADSRNLTYQEAGERAIDPDNPDFLKLQTGLFGIPLGGPYRTLYKAMISADAPFLDFGNIPGFLASKQHPLWASLRDFDTNRDFFGEKIARGEFPENVLRALGYAASQVVPISVGTLGESVLRGDRPALAAMDALGQFVGQNLSTPSEYERVEMARRGGARSLLALDEVARIAAGMTPAQSRAAGDATTLARLRERIGTRAANALVESMSPEAAGALEAYEAELRRRAGAGNRDAEALLPSIDRQRALEALVIKHTVDGIVDRVAYRNGRRDVQAEFRGQQSAFEDVYEGYRESDNEIDRLSAQWYDLWEKAEDRVTVDGREVVVGVDFERFEQLENDFFQKIGPDMASLVDANVSAAPRGANPIEVELRQLRRDLETEGFWRIEDEAWNTAQRDPALKVLLASTRLPETAQQEVIESPTFFEARQVLLRHATQILIADGFRPEVAIQRAKTDITSITAVQQFNEIVGIKKAEWAQQHVEDGLAGKALEWGYLSDSVRNIIAAEEAPQQRQQQNAPASAPPESRRIDPLTEQMAEAFAAGQSYGQIAIQFRQPSAAAVKQRLRRFSGGQSPVGTLRA